MRSLLMEVLIGILLASLILMVLLGMNIGKLRIVAVKEIIQENENLDSNIEKLNTTIENDYALAKSSLDESMKKLETSKKKYQDMIMFSTEEEIKAANQDEKYKIGYLWTKIGLYATKNDVTMQANVTTGNIQSKYNISFTILGEYISISEFIYSIENDANLGFKIEDFTLSPSTNNILKATFVIRNISIDKESLTKV